MWLWLSPQKKEEVWDKMNNSEFAVQEDELIDISSQVRLHLFIDGDQIINQFFIAKKC